MNGFWGFKKVTKGPEMSGYPDGSTIWVQNTRSQAHEPNYDLRLFPPLVVTKVDIDPSTTPGTLTIDPTSSHNREEFEAGMTVPFIKIAVDRADDKYLSSKHEQEPPSSPFSSRVDKNITILPQMTLINYGLTVRPLPLNTTAPFAT